MQAGNGSFWELHSSRYAGRVAEMQVFPQSSCWGRSISFLWSNRKVKLQERETLQQGTSGSSSLKILNHTWDGRGYKGWHPYLIPQQGCQTRLVSWVVFTAQGSLQPRTSLGHKKLCNCNGTVLVVATTVLVPTLTCHTAAAPAPTMSCAASAAPAQGMLSPSSQRGRATAVATDEAARR